MNIPCPSKDFLLNRVVPVTESGCWIWMGEVTKSHGYGVISVMINWVRTRDYAHRVFYELYKGPIPEGLIIDHLCRVRSCCNPDHLEPVTIAENVRRGESVSARYSKRTHCKHGHLFSDDNLLKCTTRPTVRICRACVLIQAGRRDIRDMSKV